MTKFINRAVSFLLAAIIMLSLLPVAHSQAESQTLTEEDIQNHQTVKNKYPTVVSLGDSYSSGEGGEDYYGKDKPIETLYEDQDWLAHRSADSWPGKLTFVNEEGKTVPLKEYRYNRFSNRPEPSCDDEKWLFAASSGAVTADFYYKQKKSYFLDLLHWAIDKPLIDSQKDSLASIKNADYVTITIGGNDVGFVDIITECLWSNKDAESVSFVRKALDYIYTGIKEVDTFADDNQIPHFALDFIAKRDDILTYRGLDIMLEDVMRNIERYGRDIKSVYKGIHTEAPDAAIIVANYPHLICPEGGQITLEADTLDGIMNDIITQIIFSEYEAKTINENIDFFNGCLNDWVEQVRASDKIPIYMADAAAEFGETGAYSSGACIEGIILGARTGELKSFELVSAKSFHPNAKGRVHYRDAVQNVIDNKVELKSLSGMVRVVKDDMSVAAAEKGYSVEFIQEDNPSRPFTIKTDSEGRFQTKDNMLGWGLTAGTYEVRVMDTDGRECGVLGNGGSNQITLMYHNSEDLDILVSPGKQMVSGKITVRTTKNKAMKADFSDDPLMLSFTNESGKTEVFPTSDQAPITAIGKRGISYSVFLFPGEYTIEAYGKNSGSLYTFCDDGESIEESVIVPIGKDVKKKNLTLLGTKSSYIGTWVDEISYSGAIGGSATTRMTLELGKMMDATLTMEEYANYSNWIGWDETGLPGETKSGTSYQGTWMETKDGIAFFLNGDMSFPIFFDKVKRNTLMLNLDKLEAMTASSSKEGMMIVALLNVLKLAMSMDIGSLFGMDFGVSTNDLLGIDSVEDLLYFQRQK